MTDNIVFIKCIDTINVILDFIKYEKGGMYLRFGDGDFRLAENMDDLLVKSNELLKNMMLNSMSIRDDRVLICLPHHCKVINTLEEGMYPGNHEYPYEYVRHFLDILKRKTNNLPEKIYTNVALSYCSAVNPDMVIELHKEIKKHDVLYIGNYQYSDEFLIKLFGSSIYRINTNWRDAFSQYEFVFSELDKYVNNKNNNSYFVIIIAAGCSSRAFASVIYEKYFVKNPNFFLFDYGSLLDYLYGMNTRAYMNLMPPKKDYILEKI
jgi:hypothetical protein